MVDNRKFPGSKWFKFDFHIHTPVSNDYNPQFNKINPEQWIKQAMEAKLDCVAVTDHNSGEWIDKLKEKNNELRNRNTKPDWYRELTIFPGVEITVGDSRSRVHLLAVFDPEEADSQKVTSLLGSFGIYEGFGDSETSTTKSFVETVNIITNAGGIAIPAHIDHHKGLLENANNLTPELKKSLNEIYVAEFREIQIYSNGMDIQLKKAVDKLAKVRGSDSHNPTKIGQHYSWIKMSRPTIEGLKLAFGDHDFCIKNQSEEPNRYPEMFLSELTIRNMKHCGRIKGYPLSIKLHPQFNTIIGGRGTGKSTILESIRIVSRRDQNLESEAPMTQKELDKFMRMSQDDGVMLNDTEILLRRQRRGNTYQIRWRQDGDGAVLEGETQEGWKEFDVGDLKNRFPISIFSQRQINELASNPQGLLGLIDRTEKVNRSSWDLEWKNTKSQFLQLRERRRELLHQLAEEQLIKGNLSDVEYDLKHYEEKGHGDILKEYQKRNQQANGITVKPVLEGLEKALNELASQTELSDFPEHLFDERDDTTTEMRKIHLELARGLGSILASLNKLADEVSSLRTKRDGQIRKSKFYNAFMNSVSAYNQLVEEYKTGENPFKLYGEWVQQRNQLLQRLENLESIRKELTSTETQIKIIQEKLKELRNELLRKRREFLNDIIGKNAFVRMELIQYGDVSTLENDYRFKLNLNNDSFRSSIFDNENKQGILLKLGTWEKNDLSESDLVQLISEIKTNTLEIAIGQNKGKDSRFDNRLKNSLETQPAIFDELDAWWPEDMLRVKYSHNPSTNKFENLDKGSAGQKAAAILAFLLSHGDEPLVIDQPEDDLDNALIYDLIVKGIHESKSKRQVIIATHNPNLVVNGDSELVNVMKYQNGQIQLDKQGGLEETEIREAICNIMEGGRQAFEKRYKRITLEV